MFCAIFHEAITKMHPRVVVLHIFLCSIFSSNFFCIIICFARYFINKFISKKYFKKNLICIRKYLQIFRRINCILHGIFSDSVYIIHLEFSVSFAISSLQLFLSHSLSIIIFLPFYISYFISMFIMIFCIVNFFMNRSNFIIK